MNCSEVQNLLSAYFDGELVDEHRSDVAVHLAECASCKSELDSFQKLSNIAQTLNSPSPPAGVWENIESKLEEQQSRPPRRQLWRLPAVQLAAAVTILIAVTLGWFVFRVFAFRP